MNTDIHTNKKFGVIGIDYNDGFIEAVETNTSGNMIHAERIILEYHGTGNKAESEIKEKLSKLVRCARDIGKHIVVEDLNLKKTKAKQQRGDGKNYNRMLHLFDYHRYLFWLKNLCVKYGVGLMKVNPAYTSRISIGTYRIYHGRACIPHRYRWFCIYGECKTVIRLSQSVYSDNPNRKGRNHGIYDISNFELRFVMTLFKVL